jgi:hypothetical protein
MAVTFQIRNASNTVIASRTIPDAALPILQDAWAAGPGTAAENALQYMVKKLYDETRERYRIAQLADEIAAKETAEANANATLETAFPNPQP